MDGVKLKDVRLFDRCRYCSKSLVKKRTDAAFCSDKCRYDYHNAKKEKINHEKYFDIRKAILFARNSKKTNRIEKRFIINFLKQFRKESLKQAEKDDIQNGNKPPTPIK